jgi:hypothetical protein
VADNVTATDNSKPFTPHPEGQYAMIPVDVVNLGQRVEQYPGKPARIVDKTAIVFQSGEVNADTGRLHEVSPEFTISMYETAKLRLFLESWKGRSYSEEEAKKGVALHKLVGWPALVSVEHKRSNKGRMYAVIKSISPLPKQMTTPVLPEYVRPDFWAKRKEQYKAEADAWAEAQLAKHPKTDDDYPQQGPEDDLDGCPF